MKLMKSPIMQYVDRIAELRRGAAAPQRQAYTVALGQLNALGLIDDATWREAIDRPRRDP